MDADRPTIDPADVVMPLTLQYNDTCDTCGKPMQAGDPAVLLTDSRVTHDSTPCSAPA